MLENTYCKNFGRPAKEPELMCKLLFLQSIYNLSDEKLIEEASLNLAHLYFLEMNPEDFLPEKSLLSKFRTQRLGEQTLDEIIIEIVRQCVKKGILKDDRVSIDATHVEANTIKKTPERLMKHLARNIIQSYEKETNESLENLPVLPDYKEISDHKKAKQIMKDYLETVSRKYSKRKRKDSQSGFQEFYKYYFDLKMCKSCPKHDQCAKKSARKILYVGIYRMNTVEFYEISQQQKSQVFKEKYKKRASIEGKNAELKGSHGLRRSKGYGLVLMSKQAKLAAIAVNLKRIAAIMAGNSPCFYDGFLFFRINFIF